MAVPFPTLFSPSLFFPTSVSLCVNFLSLPTLSSIYLSSFSLSSSTSFFSLPFFYFPHFTPSLFFPYTFVLLYHFPSSLSSIFCSSLSTYLILLPAPCFIIISPLPYPIRHQLLQTDRSFYLPLLI
jgi:hypothetical protein